MSRSIKGESIWLQWLRQQTRNREAVSSNPVLGKTQLCNLRTAPFSQSQKTGNGKLHRNHAKKTSGPYPGSYLSSPQIHYKFFKLVEMRGYLFDRFIFCFPFLISMQNTQRSLFLFSFVKEGRPYLGEGMRKPVSRQEC